MSVSGKVNVESSWMAAAERGERLMASAASSASVQLATAASVRQWQGGCEHQHPRRFPASFWRTSSV
eukprot:4833457-Pleurochrysis_carterae.AAC.1